MTSQDKSSVILFDDTVRNRIILMSDGGSSVSNDIIQLLNEKNIPVFTVGFGSNSDDEKLEYIAGKTGGEFYKAYTAEDLSDIYTEIGVYNQFDTTDSDGDGLQDNRRIYYNNTVVVPIDPNPLEHDGPDGVWLEQYKIATGMSDSGTIATEYDYSDYDVNEHMMGLSDNADEIINLLLSNDETVEKAKDYLIKLMAVLKWGSEDFTKTGADFLDFTIDDKGIAYHSDENNWQRAFGYNKIYDDIFEAYSEMLFSQYGFEYDNEEYVLWFWKGDYWNLQSGAEMGLYVKDCTKNYSTDHYDVVNYTVPMTMSLYNVNSSGVDNLIYWVPTAKQWWVTGFNASYTEPIPEDMVTISSIDLSHDTDMYEAVKKGFTDSAYTSVIYDDQYSTVWILWDDEEYRRGE